MLCERAIIIFKIACAAWIDKQVYSARSDFTYKHHEVFEGVLK